MPSKTASGEKLRHSAGSSFFKDFGTEINVERFNTTDSDEDIVKACGQVEDEVGICYDDVTFVVVSEI